MKPEGVLETMPHAEGKSHVSALHILSV